MKKWIIGAVLGLIMQGTGTVAAVDAPKVESIIVHNRSHHDHRKEVSEPLASYSLTKPTSLVTGQNVLFNIQDRRQGIQYNDTTGTFTLPAGVYFINFFATPNESFENTLNLVVNGTIIPTPVLEGSSVVVDLTGKDNTVSVQATGAWAPQTGYDTQSFFSSYVSIIFYQIEESRGNKWHTVFDTADYACLYDNVTQTLTTGQNVLFGNQISLAGIQYNSTTGVFTLPAGIYSVTYFSNPSNLNLVANGTIVLNSPLGGCATILNLSSSTNTLSLQAQSTLTLEQPTGSIPQCAAMITIYKIN
jgi:hypothetical protein